MLNHEIRSPEWIPTAPIRTATSVDIAAAPEAVWTVLADHAAWPEWFPILDRVEVTGAPTGVGGQRRVVIQRLPFDEEFTVWDEPRQFAWAVTRSRLPILSLMAESVELAATGSGCRVTLTQGLQARRGFGTVLGPMWRRNEPAIGQALDALRQRVEAAGP
jgi:uncharacterized protein YndB with AHSA1/START domain